MAKKLRLDKYLADMGLGTRSQIRDAIKKGRASVGGETVKEPEMKVDPECDQVEFDGHAVGYVDFEYYMLYKPAGTVSATEDGRYPTVLSLIDGRNRKDLFPVGRLDLDTEGFLLITNDGELAHRLLSPKRHVDKVYYARCGGKIPEDAVSKFREGLLLPDGLSCMPAELEVLADGTDGEAEVRLTLHEGKFHQVKRMMEAIGCPVRYLKRLSMGPLTLDESLSPGGYRPLKEEELELLKQI